MPNVVTACSCAKHHCVMCTARGVLSRVKVSVSAINGIDMHKE